MTTESRVARSRNHPATLIRWDEASPLAQTIETREGVLRVQHGRFLGGAADEVEVVEIDTGAARITVLPSRGMSIWSLEADGVRFGWDSPVQGPVHPARVPLFDPSGIGWLEGFDEFVVRCGLESNGAPDFEDNGQLRYPLHGRVGNLAADSLAIEYDEASGRLELIGEICESRLFVKRLTLRTRLRVRAGSAEVELLDDVTNELSTPTTIQLLYHINVGLPLLEPGATIEAPVEELAPRDDHAASEIDQWQRIGPPESGYSERVYFATLRTNDNDRTTALLRGADGTQGLGVRFATSGLPKFVIWKNTAAESDGYVCGLEPATNFPNPRSFEENQNRVVPLGSGETSSFRLSLSPLTSREAVDAMSDTIRQLSGDQPATIHRTPREGWSPAS